MTAAGKLVIILSICLHCACAEADSKDGPLNKPNQAIHFNSIQLSNSKTPEVYYQQLAQLGKYLPQQLYQNEVRSQYLQPSNPYNEASKRVFPGPHQVPVAMVIIAQPAYVPATALQPENIAQLLQYFRGNSAARFQLLHGNLNHQPQMPPAMQPIIPATTSSSQQYLHYQQVPQYAQQYPAQQLTVQNAMSYQNHEQPQARAIYRQEQEQQQVSQKLNSFQSQQPTQATYGQKLYPVILHRHQPTQTITQQSQEITYEPTQQSSAEQTQTEAPYQLNHISQIAQQAAEKFLMTAGKGVAGLTQGSSSQQQQPYRSAPAIFTGFENFSPEQQAKIKAQLSAHFGAPLQPIKVAKGGSGESQESSEQKM